jgi:signal transduction histidine kinase/ActR/RegA family two-component response regulator
MLGFLLLFAVAGAAIWLLIRQDTASFWVRHTLEVEVRVNQITTLVVEAEDGSRGYLLAGSNDYLGPYSTAKTQLPLEIAALAQETSDNPVQQRNIATLGPAIDAKLKEFEQSIHLKADGNSISALATMNNDAARKTMVQIRDVLSQMRAEERHLLSVRTARSQQIRTYALIALIGSLLLVLGLAFFAFLDGRRRILDLLSTTDNLEREISERKAAEGQVQHLQRMEIVGQLTGGIAHDFNNMLAIVIGSLDMAKRRAGNVEPKLRRSIDHAMEGAQRAAKLTARLLAFSRQQPLDPRVLDVNKQVAGTSELLLRTMTEAVRIETVLAGGLWRTYADPSQVESALVNLAVNARDAMPDGGRITIETTNACLDDAYARGHNEVAAGQYVMISVSDTGEGMSEDVIAKAFEPFFTTKGVGKGSGLGLSQVFGFAKQSGGHVKIYSEPGQGTTVKMYLPRYIGSDRAVNAIPAPSPEIPAGRREEIILVVEDEPDVRQVSAEALRELGYTVVHAGTPGEALAALEKQENVAMLFTDIVMPEMNGRQLAEVVLHKYPSLKVLYTTGYTRNAVVHNGVLDPGTAFLAKPFTVDQLARKVRETLDATDRDPA